MIRYNKKWITLLVLPLILTGCYDLDRYPSDKLSEANFPTSQEQADQLMAGVYNGLQSDNAFGLAFSMDCLGGISTGYDPPSYYNVMRGTYAINNSQVLNKWTNLYEGVARANNALQQLYKTGMSNDLIAQYKGEAKFLRALFYFELLDFFGGVPLYDETVVVSKSYADMKNPRNTAQEVRDFIIKDLDSAAVALPVQWDDANHGRATKYAAVALKGKVLLWNKQYQEAADCFQQVIDSKQYALYDDYAGLFKPGGDDSSEMIFAIQNIGGVGTNYGMPMALYMGSRETYGSCWNNVMPSSYFVDTYEYKDGRPFDWEELFPGFTTDKTVKATTFRSTMGADNKVAAYPEAKEKLLEMYSQRDPRMSASIILPYTHYTGWYANAIEECEFVIAPKVNSGLGYIRTNGNYENYLWRKFVPEGNMDGAINNRLDVPINFPLIRYADVLLMLAECKNELGDQNGAVSLINEVRARPSVDMPGINSGPSYLSATTKEEVFERIKHERAVELACEGHSFSDMKRWGLLTTLNGRIEGDITGRQRFRRNVTERDYLWPIPLSEIDQNPSLEQNPGWE